MKIYNDIGHCICQLQILPGEKPGRVTMYHGWEKFLGFQQGGWQSLTYIKIKPAQLIGKYGHINFRLNYWGPTGNNRDIKVERSQCFLGVHSTAVDTFGVLAKHQFAFKVRQELQVMSRRLQQLGVVRVSEKAGDVRTPHHFARPYFVDGQA